MAQYAFYFDQSRCYDCKACAVACKDWNQLELGPTKWLRMFEWEEGSFPELRMKALFAPCYHCEEPACLDACGADAIFKEEKYGAVLVEQEKCIGCRDCYDACPYGAPQFGGDDPAEKMSKCTMCLDRLEDGKMPICVMSCPLRALDFGTVEEITAKYGDLRQLDQMPSPDATKPSVFFKPAAERRQILPLDGAKVKELLLNLDADPAPAELPVTGLTKLVMKPASAEELMFRTRNYNG